MYIIRKGEKYFINKMNMRARFLKNRHFYYAPAAVCVTISNISGSYCCGYSSDLGASI